MSHECSNISHVSHECSNISHVSHECSNFSHVSHKCSNISHVSHQSDDSSHVSYGWVATVEWTSPLWNRALQKRETGCCAACFRSNHGKWQKTTCGTSCFRPSRGKWRETSCGTTCFRSSTARWAVFCRYHSYSSFFLVLLILHNQLFFFSLSPHSSLSLSSTLSISHFIPYCSLKYN